MDELEYSTLSKHEAPVKCVFEKSILALKTHCHQSKRKNIADREIVVCSSTVSQQQCTTWLTLLRKKSRFTLGLINHNDFNQVLPHSKEMKVQVGGLLGLASSIDQRVSGNDNNLDICNTLNKGVIEYDNFNTLPFDQIIKSVSQYRLR